LDELSSVPACSLRLPASKDASHAKEETDLDNGDLTFTLDNDASSRTAILNYYRSEIRFETEVVNARLNALLSSQSFLVIAYATSIGTSASQWGENVTLLLAAALALLGFTLAASAAPGIHAAYVAIGRWEAREHRLHAKCRGLSLFSLANEEHETRESERRSREGALFAKRAPAAFMAAWAAFFLLPAVLAFF